jgi:hypothetical protein
MITKYVACAIRVIFVVYIKHRKHHCLSQSLNFVYNCTIVISVDASVFITSVQSCISKMAVRVRLMCAEILRVLPYIREYVKCCE